MIRPVLLRPHRSSRAITIAQSSQPYAGLEQRPIKALSHQQADDLRAGRGMGLALAAELNGFAGPSHVLELGDRLGLTADQRLQVQRLFGAMKQETVSLGNKLLAQERELDDMLSAHRVTSEALKATIAAVAETQARLRESHQVSLVDRRSAQSEPDAAIRGAARLPAP